MSTEILKDKLKRLQKRREQLSYLLKMDFRTEQEFNDFKQQNSNAFDEFKSIDEEIRQLEWELMSEKQRKEHLEYQQKLKEKYSDE